MKIKVITSYKPGTWNEYAKRAVDSVLQHWPADTDVAVYIKMTLLPTEKYKKYQTAFVGQDLCQRKVHSNGTL